MPTILHGLGIDEKTSLSKIQGQNLISIIENSDEIKISLIKKSHKFNSETDSEVIAHLLEHFSKKHNKLNHHLSFQLFL